MSKWVISAAGRPEWQKDSRRPEGNPCWALESHVPTPVDVIIVVGGVLPY